MKKLFFHIILLLFTSSFPVLVNAQFYIDNTVISIDSTELKVDSMNTEIAIGGQLTLHGNDKALFYHAGDTLRNHDTIVSNGKIILESAYIASNTNALISNADSLISKGNWENALGDYSGAGVISFASIADTQFISNKPDEEGLVSVHIDGGSRKMISGNFFSINLHLKNGIIEPLTATDSIGVGFNPNIVQEDTLSFVEGKFHNQDTGSVYFPIGSDGKFRPVELRNVAEPPGWTFMTGFGPVAEANWDLLPFVSAVTGEYFLSEQTSDNNYVTFAKRYWEFDTLQGSLDGAVSRLYYNGDQDMPSGAVFTPSELIVMNADGNLTSSTYDTLGLSDSGSIASFNLDFIESNPFVGGAYNPFFYIGLKTGTCPGLVAAIKFSVSSDSAHLCPGEITNLFVDTTGTSDPSIVLNNALWQDSTENTTLTYSVSGAGVYRSIVTYNSVCKDTADNLFVSYNRTPSLDFVDNTFVTNTRIVDTLYSNSAATYSLFDIAETRNGDIYMTDTVNNQLVKLTKLDSSLTETTIPSVILPLNSPMGIASYKNKVFVADRDNKRIRMTRPLLPNILGVYAGSGGTADTTRQGTDRKSSIFESPIDIAIDSSAIMYVADNTLNAIRVISPFSGYTTIGKLPTDTVTDGNTFENHAFTNLKALTVTNDNKLIIIDGLTIKEADLTTDSIKIINGGAPSFIAPLASVDLSSVNNIYSFDNGAISFSSSATHEIILYNTSTNEYSLGAGVNGPGGFKNGATDTALFNLPQGSIVSNFGGRGFLTVDQGNTAIRTIKDSASAAFCFGLSGLVHTNASPANGTYSWSFNNTALTGEIGDSLTVSTSGEYAVTYTSPTAGNCQVTKAINVDVVGDTLQYVDIVDDITISTEDTSFCEGTSLSLTSLALDIDSTDWLNQAQVSSGAFKNAPSITVAPGQDSIVYLAAYKDICGDTIPVNLFEIKQPLIDITSTATLSCNNTSIPLSATTLGTANPIPSQNIFNWSLSTTGMGIFSVQDSISTYTAAPTDTSERQQFVLTFNNGCGVVADSSDSVDVVGAPIARIAKDPPALLATTIDRFTIIDSSTIYTPNDTNNYEYTWTFDDGAEIADDFYTGVNNESYYYKYISSGDSTKKITLKIEDAVNGCIDSTELNLQIVGYKVLYLPNAFAPDDAENDENSTFKSYGVNISDEGFSLVIFNRWGETIHAMDYEQASTIGWNGQKDNDGVMLEAGVYTYQLIGKYTDNKDFSRTGSVTLIR